MNKENMSNMATGIILLALTVLIALPILAVSVAVAYRLFMLIVGVG